MTMPSRSLLNVMVDRHWGWQGQGQNGLDEVGALNHDWLSVARVRLDTKVNQNRKIWKSDLMATTSSHYHCEDFHIQWPDLTTTKQSSRFESLIDLMWRQLVGQNPTTFSVTSGRTQVPLGHECEKNVWTLRAPSPTRKGWTWRWGIGTPRVARSQSGLPPPCPPAFRRARSDRVARVGSDW